MPTSPTGVRYGATNGFVRTATFKAAWTKIKRKGWTREHGRGPKGEYSIWAAIKESMRDDESIVDYQEHFLKHLGGHLDHWETKRGRTKQEVLDLLRDM